MDENAGIHIAIGVDVEISAPPDDAAAHIFGIALEIHGKEGLAGAPLTQAAIDHFALLRAGQKFRRGIIAHGHAMEIPDEIRALFDQHIEGFLRGDAFIIDAGTAGGNAIDQLALMENIHGPNHLIKYARAPAAVGGLPKALQGDSGHEIPDPQHIIGKGLVDQGAIGKAEEDAVIMLFAEADQIRLAHQRPAAGIDIHV